MNPSNPVSFIFCGGVCLCLCFLQQHSSGGHYKKDAWGNGSKDDTEFPTRLRSLRRENPYQDTSKVSEGLEKGI